MNHHQKYAGQSTRDMAERRYKSRVHFVLFTVGAVLLIWVVAYNANALGIGALGFVGLIVLARLAMNYADAKTKRMMKEERRAIRGAKGEEKIGALLEDLGEDYFVLHDIQSPHGNIDHIVIRKQSGIFLIETKAHGGRVSTSNERLFVNGHEPEKDFIAQALSNTYWLRDKIRETTGADLWVVPILVFTNAFVERAAPIKGVSIINKKLLLNILQRPNAKAQNLAVWEQRESITKALCS